MRFLAAILLAIAAQAALAMPANAVPNVREIVTGKGIRVWFVEDHTLPIISMSFAFIGGAAADAPDRLGQTRIGASLLDQGAGDLDAKDFQEKLESLAVKLDFAGGEDRVGGSLRTLSDAKEEAFSLLGLAVTRPRFDPALVSLRQSQFLAALENRKEQAGAQAALKQASVIFAGHPYGRDGSGTPETIKALTSAQLKAWAERALARDNLVIGLAGDVTPDEAKRLIDLAFGDLAAHAALSEIPKASPHFPARIDTVSINQPQTVILFAAPGISNRDPDWYAARVMNEILGGGIDSRLSSEVREKRGLTYGVETSLDNRRAADLFSGGLQTRNEKAGEAIAALKEVMAKMAKDGATESEVADARAYMTGSYDLALDTGAKIAAQLAAVQAQGLGIRYFTERNKKIEAVTRYEVNAAAAKLLHPDALYFSVAGKPEGIGN